MNRTPVLLFSAAVYASLAFAQDAVDSNQLRSKVATQTAAVTTVPRLVRVSNTFHPANGQSTEPVEGVTLSIYATEQGGAPLWQETQNVSIDAEGHYSILLGSTVSDGLPLDLFQSGEPRWLGVRFNRSGEVEQPRTLLTSVPYALRASDAETLGGLPASAYQLAPAANAAAAAVGTALVSGSAPGSTPVAKSLKPRATSGTANYIGLFTDATDLGNSVMYQNGSRIGLGTIGPFDFFHVRFTDTTGGFTGYAVQNLGAGAASYSGMLFYDQNGLLGQFQGFNNSTHEYRINNIASGGTINFMIGSSSKFYVANSGNIGIGTATPATNLDVAGNINFSGNVLYQGTSLLTVPGGTGSGNTAIGAAALVNPSGTHNTATGFQALNATTTGCCNAAVGWSALALNTTGGSNVAIGGAALSLNTTGSNNTAAGFHALNVNSTGNLNTAVGGSVLSSNTTGNNNTAVGQAAMVSNTTGCCNVAVGQAALTSNTTANANVAVGGSALQDNTTGGNNTALGQGAMLNNTTGCCNVAIGQAALNNNTTANSNVAVGGSALQDNTTGAGNTAVGQAALLANTTGCNNVAVGPNALASNTTLCGDTAVGAGALAANVGTQNTALGTGALGSVTSGFNNIAIGWGAASAFSGGNSGNIHIGTKGASGDGNTIRIGGGTSGIADSSVQTAFFVAGVNGVTTGMNNAVEVMIDSNGQLGTTSSSRRYKEDIQDMGDASHGLMRLRPVTFRYKRPFEDGSKPVQYGLIAEEVAEVYPDLVARSADGQIETVKYQVLAPMLLNEVQRQAEQIKSLQAQLQLLQQSLARLEEAQASSRQAVGNQR